MTRHTHLGRLVWPMLLFLLLAACRGNTITTTPQPIPPTTAAAEAPPPTPRPEVTPSATFVLPFPAPEEDTGRTGDPTLPTRTPTPAADAAPLPTPVCNDPTPATAEGPFYLPNTPERAALREAGMAGQPLLISGYVLDADCNPIPGAWLDFWQADASGVYDTASFRLRGHQFTDANGRYQLDTILPGPANGRPRHIYVKVQPPNGPVLTTQIFFPDEAGNAADADFRPALTLTLSDAQTATFDFVVATE